MDKNVIKENFNFLCEVLPRLKNIRNMEEACCISVRNAQLKIIMNRLYERLGMKCLEDDPVEAYNDFRRLLIKTNDITNTERFLLISKMC